MCALVTRELAGRLHWCIYNVVRQSDAVNVAIYQQSHYDNGFIEEHSLFISLHCSSLLPQSLCLFTSSHNCSLQLFKWRYLSPAHWAFALAHNGRLRWKMM